MKKWLAILVLFFTTAKTFFPCFMADDCAVKKCISTDNTHEDGPDGDCPPCFYCAVCAGSIDIAKCFEIGQPPMVTHVPYDGMILFHPTAYVSSFWQPPRYS